MEMKGTFVETNNKNLLVRLSVKQASVRGMCVYVRIRESSVKITLRKRTPLGINILYLCSGCKMKKRETEGKVCIFINPKERSLTTVFGK